MKTRQKLTPWIDGHIKPVRKGVYQRNYGAIDDLPDTPFSRWDGKQWFGADDTVNEAFFNDFVSRSQYLPWRGLASNPRAKK